MNGSTYEINESCDQQSAQNSVSMTEVLKRLSMTIPKILPRYVAVKLIYYSEKKNLSGIILLDFAKKYIGLPGC